MSEWRLAESNYLRVIELSPEYVGVRNRLTRLYLFVDQPEKALEILEMLSAECISGCAEKDALKSAIDGWKADNK